MTEREKQLESLLMEINEAMKDNVEYMRSCLYLKVLITIKKDNGKFRNNIQVEI